MLRYVPRNSKSGHQLTQNNQGGMFSLSSGWRRAVDTGIGNVTAAIRAVPGLWEETLLIITSDNVRVCTGTDPRMLP